jgi:chromosome segregation ATPase
MRFEALQARAGATDKLLIEAREHLLARAEDIREFDKTAGEIALERDSLQAKVAELEAERIKRESEFKEINHARANLIERSAQLARAFTAKEAALARSEEANAALNQRIGDLETSLAFGKQSAAEELEELKAALRREKMERSVTEGALETARKDFARLMREVMTLQRDQMAKEPRPRAANAA